MPAAGLTALSAALRTSVIPLRYPFGGSGHPVEVVERRPHAGRDRRYRPDRPLSRVVHLHQACMDHPLEVARQRLQVDGKPHPTAPSHPQAPKPVGAASAREFVPSIPALMSYRLRHSSVGLGPPAPLDVHLHQVRLEDVVPRTPVQLHWANGIARGMARMLSRQSGPLPAPAHPSARTPRWTGGRRGTPWPAPL